VCGPVRPTLGARLEDDDSCLHPATLTSCTAAPTVAAMRTLLELIAIAAGAVTAFWTFVP